MPKIIDVRSICVLNSRGDLTIKTYLELEDGRKGSFIVPEGASKGLKEAISIDAKKACEIINSKIAPLIKQKVFKDQKEFDDFLKTLDSTPNKEVLGGNALLSLSVCFCKATNFLLSLYFLNNKPSFGITPLFNILNGGKHAKNGLSFQEFMIIPSKKYSFDRALEIGAKVYKNLKDMLQKDDFSTGVGDEGGFAPYNFTARKALSYIRDSINKDYRVGEDVFLGLDVAAGSFYSNGNYVISEENLVLSPQDYIYYLYELVREYEIIYLEDPFFEEDEDSWFKFRRDLKNDILVCGDDLVVTNLALLNKVLEKNLANCFIVKPNQVGTISETLDFVNKVKSANLDFVVSHRSGDTEDTFIADFSFAVGAPFVKFGSLARGERTCKYNRLLEIFNFGL